MTFLQSVITVVFLTISAVLPLYLAAYVQLLIASRRYTHPLPTALKQYPTVSIHLPIFNEKHVVARLVNAVCRLDYPFDKLEIVVVDDSVDETSRICEELVRRHRSQGVNITYIKRDNRTGFKAGALQHALQNSRGEFIAVFDADFVPQPDFLKKILTYFSDEKVGVVQARWGHLNRDYSTLTAAQALSLDLHFIVEQKGRFAGGYFLNFNGTAGVWRRKCIEDAGGWRDSLAEDLDLSYRAQLKGWRVVYVDDVVVPAEIPVQMKAVRRQQYRWAYGAVQTTLRYLFQIIASNLSAAVKIQAFIHLTRHVPQLLLTAQVLMVPFVASGIKTRFDFMAGWMALYPLLVTLSLLLTAKTFLKQQYNSLPRFVKDVLMMFLWGLGMSVNNSMAVIHAFLKRGLVFERTPKFGIVGRRGSWRKSSYSILHEPYVVFDFVIGAYSLYASLYCFYTRAYSFLPLTTLYTLSLLYTAFTSIAQRPRQNKPTRSNTQTYAVTIALAIVFTVAAVQSFASIVYPLETSISSIERAVSSADYTVVVALLDEAVELLPAQGNPVWILPTARTDYRLIRHDLQSIKERMENINRNDIESYHAAAEDARYALNEVVEQLRRIQPYAWLSVSNLSAYLIIALSFLYRLVRESHG